MIHWFFSYPFGSNESLTFAKALFKKTGIKIRDPKLYFHAITHPSVINAFEDLQFDRLEFLGDSVIDLVVRKRLFKLYPTITEGELTKMTSRIVSRKSLNHIAKSIHLEDLVKVNDSGISERSSIYGNALEALIGAFFLDVGFKRVEKHIWKLLQSHIDFSKIHYDQNSKGILIEWAQKNKRTWRFNTFSSENEEYAFCCELYIDDVLVALNFGQSKKEAEKKAAKDYGIRMGLMES